MSDIEKYAVRYNTVVIAEALGALALHITRRLCDGDPKRQYTLPANSETKG